MSEFLARSSQSPAASNAELPSQKRHRIVERLSEGIDRAKTRKFTFSKLMYCVGSIARQDIADQIKMLDAHAVVTYPMKRTPKVLTYLTQR